MGQLDHSVGDTLVSVLEASRHRASRIDKIDAPLPNNMGRIKKKVRMEFFSSTQKAAVWRESSADIPRPLDECAWRARSPYTAPSHTSRPEEREPLRRP